VFGKDYKLIERDKMFFDLVQIIGLAVVAYIWYLQQQRIELLELVVGHMLISLDKGSNEDVVDHQ